jgi:hypothetical protein
MWALQTNHIDQQRAISPMKIITLFMYVLAFAFDANAASREVFLIGHFTNQTISDGEDAHILNGYTVNLYRIGGIIFGDIDIGVGSEEAAHGTLVDLHFDEATKSLAFKASYIEGLVIDKRTGPAGRESIVALSFSGRITSNSVNGRLILKSWHEGLSKLDIVLKRTENNVVPDSFEQWKRANGTLKTGE